MERDDRDWYARWFDQAVDIPGPGVRRARRDRRASTRCYLAIPVNERDGGTVYNTICYFGPDGALAREAPQAHARPAASGSCGAQGDGSTLAVIDTPFGRVGGLICWENYMPLARAAMYEQGIDVLLAPTWDNSDVWPLSMQHIAKEGRCYVLGITSCQRGADVPADLPGRDEIYAGRRRLDVARQHDHRRPVGRGARRTAHRRDRASSTRRSTPTQARLSRREFDVVGPLRAPRRVPAPREPRRRPRAARLRAAMRSFNAKIASIGPGSTSFCSAR